MLNYSMIGSQRDEPTSLRVVPNSLSECNFVLPRWLGEAKGT